MGMISDPEIIRGMPPRQGAGKGSDGQMTKGAPNRGVARKVKEIKRKQAEERNELTPPERRSTKRQDGRKRVFQGDRLT